MSEMICANTISSRMHYPVHFFAGWQAPCRRLARNESKNMGSYNTNLLVSPRAKPTNIAEECLSKLLRLGSAWPQVYRNGVVARTAQIWRIAPFHTDRDRSLQITDRANYPSVLVEHPVSEPISFDRRPSSSIKCWVPMGNRGYRPDAKSGMSARRCSNEYAVFRGDLRHGVVANGAPQKPPGRSRKTKKPPSCA